MIFLDQGKIPLAMITTLKKLKSGYINGTRVALGNLNDFLSTSCITNLSFLGSSEDGRPDKLNPQVYKIQMAYLFRIKSQPVTCINKIIFKITKHVFYLINFLNAISQFSVFAYIS